MSLLMDALRKAEEQKRLLAGQGEAQAKEQGAPHIDLEPLLVQTTPAPELNATSDGGRLPDLPSKLEDLDDQFIAHAQQSDPKVRSTPVPQQISESARSSAESRSSAVLQDTPKTADDTREAARNLFEAKQGKAKSNKNFAIAAGLLGMLAAIGIGGYFWWQLQPKSSLMLAGTVQAPPVTVPAGNAAPPASTSAPPVPLEPPPRPIAQTSTDLDDEPEPPVVQPAQKRVAPPPVAPPLASAPEPASPIRVGKAPRKLDPALEQAYQAFNRGDLSVARSEWQKVLATDPHNPDALHGLATVSLRQGHPEEAVDYYRRALEADPKDALALAGLISMRAPVDALQTESRLKSLLSEQPESPYLNFALGNLYAKGMRWAEAQAAFFKAYAADPDNPDYLFNLAVSLDQLRQPRLALQYYNQALEAAKLQAASFDATQVTARVTVLQSSR